MGDFRDRVATIVLAAGRSSRMKGVLKALLKLGDDTVVERAVKAHLAAGIQDVRVVVGHRADEVAAAVGHLGVGVVNNRHFEKGMFSSVQAGVATLKPDTRAFFIMPVDIPLVDPSTIRAILAVFEEDPRGVVHPVYRGRRGHPPLIPGNYIPEIMASAAPPDGLRGILNNHEAEARGVEVDDEAVLLDMDTLKDYRRLLSYGNRERIPDGKECMNLLEEAGAEEPVRAHGRAVADVACRLVRLLNNAGVRLNGKLVSAAALLHDIRRGEKDHAQAGATFLRMRGYGRVAEIVAAHMDMGSAGGGSPTETEIVYLADKLVAGRCRVSLDERFAAALERHKGDEKVLASIVRRREHAEKIRNTLERIVGCPLEEMPLMNPDDPAGETPAEG
ncbi:MAG TPA: NTP transferase domain-containing protein [Syntrophales bacterium]|nr:NTP transferase domain-containing protein [Syntrophales bacterium]HQQ28635.1 NTP transferase domain-containing protein [Syntrophales bacterium]